jgi:threonine synthase
MTPAEFIFYSSTRNGTASAGFSQAMAEGLAPDGGLYMPDAIPQVKTEWLHNLQGAKSADIGAELLKPWLGDSIAEQQAERLIREALNFEAPLVRLNDSTFILELFHGPTCAFKDFAARTMGRLMASMLRREGKTLHVLAATSGDTGAAVAHGFHNIEGIRVWVLYPSGKVSTLQEKQFTTLGGNVTALEVTGTFDDCQRLVKQAFRDNELRSSVEITSANSINIARLIPQMVYYFSASAQLQNMGIDAFGTYPPLFVVPSGNFGNLTAGLFAGQSGLPVSHFVAACNENRTFYEFLKTGIYSPRKSVTTLSNAMDVGDPSNFERIHYHFNHSATTIKEFITPYWTRDKDTSSRIVEVHSWYNYIMDPHTAVGYDALKKHREANGKGSSSPAVILATAHPVKFSDVMPDEVKAHIPLPEQLKECISREKKSVRIAADYPVFRELLFKSEGQHG